MTLTNFRASDFNGSTPKRVPSKRDRVTEPTPTTRPIIAADANPEDVPAGTVPEVLTWVGDDPVRAQKALDAELADSKPRKGLLSELQDKVDKEAEVEEPKSVNDAENKGHEEGDEPDASPADPVLETVSDEDEDK